jgi:hypothetical protein
MLWASANVRWRCLPWYPAIHHYQPNLGPTSVNELLGVVLVRRDYVLGLGLMRPEAVMPLSTTSSLLGQYAIRFSRYLTIVMAHTAAMAL